MMNHSLGFKCIQDVENAMGFQYFTDADRMFVPLRTNAIVQLQESDIGSFQSLQTLVKALLDLTVDVWVSSIDCEFC